MALSFIVGVFPRLREAYALRESATAATTLIRVLDRKELGQLLADTAKAGISGADAAVVHTLGGEDGQWLVPLASSNLDLTTLGKTPMHIGAGIAGHAVADRLTINVPDIRHDRRYQELPPAFVPFISLLSAPMYVAEKNIGTVSVHSAKGWAFDERDSRFLTTLAAHGATALANAELFDHRVRRRQQISNILASSSQFVLDQPLPQLLQAIATAVCQCSTFRMAVVNLLDETTNEVVVCAMEGVPETGQAKLRNTRFPYSVLSSLLTEDFRISTSYFVRHDRNPVSDQLDKYSYTPALGKRKPGEWHQDDILLVPMYTQQDHLIGYISVDDPQDLQLPSLDTIQALEILARVGATAIQNRRLVSQTEQAREAEQYSARILYLLHRISIAAQTMTGLDRIINVILTGITADYGLGINRAALFRLDEATNELVGYAGIGQFSEQDARATWERIRREGSSFDEHLRVVAEVGVQEWTPVHNRISGKRISLSEEPTEALSLVVTTGKPLCLSEDSDIRIEDQLMEAFEPRAPIALLPLKSRNEVLGVLVCDNKFTGTAIGSAEIDMLITFANQAAAAFESAQLFERTVEIERIGIRDQAIRVERQRLETDLHEAMGTLATGVKWEAEILADEIAANRRGEQLIALGRLRNALDRAYLDLRHVLQDLRDPTLEEEGLLAALNKQADLIGRSRVIVTGNVNCRFVPKVEGVLYRVALEAIHNAIEHSGFAENPDVKVVVDLNYDQERVNLCIMDSGIGFDVQSVLSRSDKWGLRRLKDYVHEMGSELRITSAPNQGSTICVAFDRSEMAPCPIESGFSSQTTK